MAASHRCRPSKWASYLWFADRLREGSRARSANLPALCQRREDIERLQAGFEAVQQVDPLEPILPAQRLARELRDFVKLSQGRAAIWRVAEDRPAIRRW